MAVALARAYGRSAIGYVLLFLGVLVAVLLAYTSASIWIFARYFDVRGAEFGLLLAAGLSGVLIGLAVSGAIAMRNDPAIVQWLAGGSGTEAGAVDAWCGLARFPTQTVRRAMFVSGSVTAPLLTLAGAHTGLSAEVIATLIVGMVVLTIGCGSFALILIDIFLRPIRTKIDEALPLTFAPSHVAVGMTQRISAELSLLILAPAFLTAGLLAPPGGGTEAFATAFLVSGAVTVAFSGLIGQALVERVSGPVRDLLAGTRAVTSGDLGTRIPLASTDEHLVLVDSFNRMVTGLRERQALHSAVGSYIDPAIAERIMAEGAAIDGEAVDVTVLFLDIVGFTALAEDASAEDVVSDLNDFFGLVIPVIVERGGHANKLLGDGLMAVFGTPIVLDDHADRALAAALEIQRQLADRYAGRMRAGAGLNSGMVVVGSMGGGTKLDYTIIGDAVNVAARVEAHTRTTGDEILLTDATRDRLADPRGLRPRGTHVLKGRTAAVGLWTPSEGGGLSPGPPAVGG